MIDLTLPPVGRRLIAARLGVDPDEVVDVLERVTVEGAPQVDDSEADS